MSQLFTKTHIEARERLEHLYSSKAIVMELCETIFSPLLLELDLFWEVSIAIPEVLQALLCPFHQGTAPAFWGILLKFRRPLFDDFVICFWVASELALSPLSASHCDPQPCS